jgi:hypothetical protein
MAILSTTSKQVHHEEYDHFSRFYIEHWLPPAVAVSSGVVVWLECRAYCRVKDFRSLLRSLGMFAATIVATAGPRIAYDLHVNGSPAQKQARIIAQAEALAAPIFKPSMQKKGSLNLRGKGVSLRNTLRPPLSWARHSFFGSYNYNSIQASPSFYYLFLGTYGIFLIYLTAIVALRGDMTERVVLCAATASSMLVIGLSLYHSWTSDFQPQGRYLFAIFGLVAIVVARNRHVLNPTIVNPFLVGAFLLSAYSFVTDGLANLPRFQDLLEISSEFRRPV